MPPMGAMASLGRRFIDNSIVQGSHYTHEAAAVSKWTDNSAAEFMQGTQTLRPTRLIDSNNTIIDSLPRVGNGNVKRNIGTNRAAQAQPETFTMPNPVPGSNLSVAENIMKSKPVNWAMNKMGISDAGQATNDMMAGNALQQLGGVGKMMWAGSNMDRLKKIGAVAGIYSAANLAGRVVTGGGPFHNGSGDRDIMGIPFI
jgi:hypothetical protein